MNILDTEINKTYIIKRISTNDKNMEDFLFSLGCYPGEEIKVISNLSSNLILFIKGARYSINDTLAKCIIVNKD